LEAEYNDNANKRIANPFLRNEAENHPVKLLKPKDEPSEYLVKHSNFRTFDSIYKVIMLKEHEKGQLYKKVLGKTYISSCSLCHGLKPISIESEAGSKADSRNTRSNKCQRVNREIT
jgi:hypothetical protein